MMRIAVFAGSLCLALGSQGAPAIPALSPGCLRHWNPFDNTPQTDLWCPGAHGSEPAEGDEDYKCYKIPSLLRTGNGTLLAFVEARKFHCGDGGASRNNAIDVRMRRSFDSGKSWTQSQLILGESTADLNVTIGDACPVWDEATQTVHLVLTRQNTDTLYMRSADLGATWTSPKDISAQVGGPHYFSGTGHAGGLQLPSGRLIIPMHGDPNTCHAVFSDDHGETWQQGGNGGGDECQMQRLLNGTLIAVSRPAGGKGDNTIAYSHDEGLTWTTPLPNKDLLSPIAGCETSILAHPNGKLYHSGPESRLLRINMVVKVSDDQGLTWKKVYNPWTAAAGYSALALLGANASDINAPVGLLYERNRAPMIVFEARGMTFTSFEANSGSMVDTLQV